MASCPFLFVTLPVTFNAEPLFTMLEFPVLENAPSIFNAPAVFVTFAVPAFVIVPLISRPLAPSL